MHLNLRLRFLKALLNVPVRLLDRFLPDREPAFPQTVIGDRMFERMFRVYSLERAQGVFCEKNGALEDGNFLRLQRTSRKLWLAIGDDDRYYREWLGLLVILASEEHRRWLAEVSPVKYLANRRASSLISVSITCSFPTFILGILTFDRK